MRLSDRLLFWFFFFHGVPHHFIKQPHSAEQLEEFPLVLKQHCKERLSFFPRHQIGTVKSFARATSGVWKQTRAEIHLRRCRAHLACLRPYCPSPTPQQMKEAQIVVASSQKLYFLNVDLNDFCIMHLHI